MILRSTPKKYACDEGDENEKNDTDGVETTPKSTKDFKRQRNVKTPLKKKTHEEGHHSINVGSHSPIVNVHIHLHSPNGDSSLPSKIQPIIHLHLQDSNNRLKNILSPSQTYKKKNINNCDNDLINVSHNSDLNNKNINLMEILNH